MGFVNSNLNTLSGYIRDIFSLLNGYDNLIANEPIAPETLEKIRALKIQKDLDYLRTDAPQLIAESLDGLARVRSIIQDLKNFSRVDSNNWELTDLHKSLDSTLNMVWNELKYHCTVHKEYGDIPAIYCLPSQLHQVFMNLLINAAQAIKGKGDITVRTGRLADEVWVEIADSGSGISPEHINRLFEPFFTTKPVGKGTGLGLSISQNIVEKHHGRIEVKSEIDKGTTFRICLPIEHSE
ncbi:MAG: ATP-binding protein [Methylococcaceae bacterium]|nr:ATP-binding protein [Methylococcaceae bacterium]